MKKFLIFGILLLAAVIVLGCSGFGTKTGQGTVVATIADAKADMGPVSSVIITVDSVEIHSNASGWVTLSDTPATYDLLALKSSNDQVLLSNVNISSGTYEQARLIISKVVVTDSNGTHDAKLPSSELKIVGITVVAENETSVIKFDFLVNESLHVTGSGQYIMAPVVFFESKSSATVNIGSDNTVEVGDGKVRESTKVGMDENGIVGVDKGIPNNVNLTLLTNGKISRG
jgi:hypothetical protein